jgi:magnesium-transporting ATPase (P-type)
LFLWEHAAQGDTLAEARTVVVNVIVMVEAFYLLNCRSLTHSMFFIGVFANRFVWLGIALMMAAQLAFTYLPIMNRLFHTAPLGLESWLLIVGVGVVAYAVVGFEKWVRFGRHGSPLAREST